MRGQQLKKGPICPPPMTSAGPVYVFPDTNVFLEFLFIDQIDWRKLAGSTDVVLVVTATVVAELDKHKYENRSAKKREIAQRVLIKLEDLSESGEVVREGVRLELLLDRPPATMGLDLEDPDNRHIATVLHFRDERGVQVMIATADAGMRLKSRPRSINLLKMPDDLKRQAEPNEHEVELRKLRAQAARQPRLKVAFADGTPVLGAHIRPRGTMSDAEIEHLVKLELTTAMAIGAMTGREAYAKALHAYYQRLRDFKSWQAHTVRAAIVLRNEGEAPAEDIDLAIKVPERIEVTTSEEKEPEKPEPPNSPLAIIRLLSPTPGLAMLPSLYDLSPDSSRAWSIEENEATFWVRRLKQHDASEFPTLFLRPKDRDDREGFAIEAVVRVGKPASTESCALHVTLQGRR